MAEIKAMNGPNKTDSKANPAAIPPEYPTYQPQRTALSLIMALFLKQTNWTLGGRKTASAVQPHRKWYELAFLFSIWVAFHSHGVNQYQYYGTPD